MYCNNSVRRSILPVALALCGLLTAVVSPDRAIAQNEPPRAPIVTEAAEPPRTYTPLASADGALAKGHKLRGKGQTEAGKSDSGADRRDAQPSAAKILQTWQLKGADKTTIRLSQAVDGKRIVISVEQGPSAVLLLTVRGATADDVSVHRAAALKLDPQAVSRESLRSGGAAAGAAKSRSSLGDPSLPSPVDAAPRLPMGGSTVW